MFQDIRFRVVLAALAASVVADASNATASTATTNPPAGCNMEGYPCHGGRYLCCENGWYICGNNSQMWGEYQYCGPDPDGAMCILEDGAPYCIYL
jgi:hypothetical protein